jgi:hypothetical protein
MKVLREFCDRFSTAEPVGGFAIVARYGMTYGCPGFDSHAAAKVI